MADVPSFMSVVPMSLLKIKAENFTTFRSTLQNYQRTGENLAPISFSLQMTQTLSSWFSYSEQQQKKAIHPDTCENWQSDVIMILKCIYRYVCLHQ